MVTLPGMSTRTVVMFALAVVAALVWLLRFIPAIGMNADVADFFGGVATGVAIGAVIVWVGERPPRD